MSKYKADILRLRAEGKTYNQIVNQLGCTKSTVCYYLGSDQAIKTADRQRDRRSKVKQYVQQVKQANPCADCGENYPYWIMEFDHLGEKLFNISNFYHQTISLEVIKLEIAKCEIVCANCHKNRTYLRSIKTGSSSKDVSMYYN